MVRNVILTKIGNLLGRNLEGCEFVPAFGDEELRKLRSNQAVLDEIYEEIRQASPASGHEVTATIALENFNAVRPVSEADIRSSFDDEYVTSRTESKTSSVRTLESKPNNANRDWVIIDATDKMIGRMAAEIARRLRSRGKQVFNPHADEGNYVVVFNVEKLRVADNWAQNRSYFRPTGLAGHLTETDFFRMQERFAARSLEKAVKNLLPKGRRGYAMMKNMKCYVGSEYPHEPEQLVTVSIGGSQVLKQTKKTR